MAGLTQFVKSRCELLEKLDQARGIEKGKVEKQETYRNNQFKNVYFATKKHCCWRKRDHAIYHCEKFLELNINDRIAQVKKSALCINYLKPNHVVKDCEASSCRRCYKKHYSLLHFNNACDGNKPEIEVSISSQTLRNQPSEVPCYFSLRTVKEKICHVKLY